MLAEKTKNNYLVKILTLGIKIYQLFISPMFGTSCRFYPSCSEYFKISLERKGIVKGSMAGIIRIIRCNPFNPGGYDPVKE